MHFFCSSTNIFTGIWNKPYGFIIVHHSWYMRCTFRCLMTVHLPYTINNGSTQFPVFVKISIELNCRNKTKLTSINKCLIFWCRYWLDEGQSVATNWSICSYTSAWVRNRSWKHHFQQYQYNTNQHIIIQMNKITKFTGSERDIDRERERERKTTNESAVETVFVASAFVSILNCIRFTV